MKAKKSMTKNGELVRSVGEQIIADALKSLDILYIYEIPLKVAKYTLLPDFYLPSFEIFIEFWGMISNEEYRDKMQWKLKHYAIHHVPVVSIFPSDVYKNKELKKILLQRIKEKVKYKRGDL